MDISNYDSKTDLFQKNLDLVYYMISRYYPLSIQDEDIIQNGMIGLWKACVTYDESLNMFSTYASKCILNEIRMYFRSFYNRGKKDITLVSLEDVIHADEHTDLTLEDTIPVSDVTTRTTEEAILAREIINKLWNRLDNRCKKILYWIFVCDMTQAEVANILGVSRSLVSKKVADIRKLAKYYYMEGNQ